MAFVLSFFIATIQRVLPSLLLPVNAKKISPKGGKRDGDKDDARRTRGREIGRGRARARERERVREKTNAFHSVRCLETCESSLDMCTNARIRTPVGNTYILPANSSHSAH